MCWASAITAGTERICILFKTLQLDLFFRSKASQRPLFVRKLLIDDSVIV
jgi:hypothetical protein